MEGEKPLERVFISKITIENFKSIKHLELPLKPGINLLVGSNASGKTNILEALSFLRKALIEDKYRAPYMPHVPKYWSGKDLVYLKDPSRTVRIGLTIEHYLQYSDEAYVENIELTTEFTYDPGSDTLIPSRYLINISGNSNSRNGHGPGTY